MAKLYIEPVKARGPASREADLAQTLRSLAGEVDDIRSNLRYKIAGQEQISARLRTVSQQVTREGQAAQAMKNGLEQIIARYEQAENKCVGQAQPVKAAIQDGGGGGNGSGSDYSAIINGGVSPWTIPTVQPTPSLSPWDKPILDAMKQYYDNQNNTGNTPQGFPAYPKWSEILGKIKTNPGIIGIGFAAAETMVSRFLNDGAIIGDSRSWESTDGGVSRSGSLSWDFIGHSQKINPGEISREFHVAQGEVKGSVGLLSGSADVKVGQAEAKGKVGATLFKDGKFVPRIEASAGAEATALSGTAKGQLGTDNTNLHVKASGKVLTAEAKIKGNAGVYEDADGNRKIGLNLEGKAGAEVVSGKVSGGLTILGVKIDASLEGSVGAKAEAKGEIASTGMEFKLGAALGLGAGIDIKIDWSNFKFGW